MLPKGTTVEQAYPVVKALIVANSARRQGVPDDEFLGGLIAEMEAMSPIDEPYKPSTMIAQHGDGGQSGMWTTSRESADTLHMHTDDKDPEYVHDARELSPEQKKGIEDLLAKDPKMAEDRASASARNQNNLMIPPGIDAETSGALAKRLESSAVAVEKLQMSAKSFGVIKPDDDINLTAKELVNLSASRQSFGMVATPTEDSAKIVDDHVAQFLKRPCTSLQSSEKISWRA